MAGELIYRPTSDETEVNFIIHNPANRAQVWDDNGSAWATYDVADIDDYKIAGTDPTGRQVWGADWPAGITAAGVYPYEALDDADAHLGFGSHDLRTVQAGTRTLLALPAVAHSTSGGLPTNGTGNHQISLAQGAAQCAGFATGIVNTQIWGALLANQTTANTIGKKLADLGVGADGDIVLSTSGLDQILVEAGITPGASLTNESTTQLSAINARQAIALLLSALSGIVSGAPSGPILIKPGGKSTPNRISATVDASGNRSALTLIVPD